MRNAIITNGSTPSLLTVSWDQVLDGDLPHPLPPQATRLVHEATAAAKAALPALHERLDRARDLVLAGAVSLNEDGSFTVTSQSRRGTSYRVDGACPCQGAVQEPRCKHVLVRRESGR